MKNGKNYIAIFPIYGVADRNTLASAVGYFLRCALAFLCSYGCVRTVFTSIAAPLPEWILPVSCLVFCTVISFCLLSKRASAAGVIGLILSLSAFFVYMGGVYKIIFAMAGSVKNAWSLRLDDLGYVAVTDSGEFAKLLDEIGRTETEMYMYAAVFASFIVCTAVCLFTLRKVRPVLLFASVLALTAYFLLYGAVEDEKGCAAILVCAAAFAVMFFYENTFVNRKSLKCALQTDAKSYESRRELSRTVCRLSQFAGYYGAAAALIAALIIAVPLCIDRPMADIPSVSGAVNRAVDVVSAAAEGHIPERTGFMYVSNGQLKTKSTAIDDRIRTTDTVMTVAADLDLPVYLRSWTGVDYRNDSWHSVSYSRMSSYRRLLGASFSAEGLTNELLYAIDPGLTALPENMPYVSHEDFGYVILPVHVKMTDSDPDALCLPSYSDPDTNLLGYGTRIGQKSKYTGYYEGIYTLNGSPKNDGYSVKAHLALPATAETLTNISQLVRYYSAQLDIVSVIRKLLEEGAEEEALADEYLKISAEASHTVKTLSGRYSFPASPDSLAYRYTHTMTEDERARVNALVDGLAAYNNYVYANYLSVCENYEAFDALADVIIEKSGRATEYTYPGRHRTVEAVIDYLSESMTYTLTPKKPTEGREYYNSAETFLFDTGEGYCVQYATSAVMLLRCLGIPARYAVGYIADEFEPSPGGVPGVYTSAVTAEKAHAWIEVYYDYYGWIQYEATAPLKHEQPPVIPPVENSNESEILPAEKEDPDPDGDSTVVNGDVNEPTEGGTEKPDILGKAVVFAVCTVLALAAAATLTVLCRGRRAEQKLLGALLKAKSADLNPEQRVELAKVLGEYIMKLLAVQGFMPGDSERPADFYKRVSEGGICGEDMDFCAVGETIRACEFGNSVREEGVALLCRCTERLYASAKSRRGIISAIYIKYFVLAS